MVDYLGLFDEVIETVLGLSVRYECVLRQVGTVYGFPYQI
jgi:hypothetical protein